MIKKTKRPPVHPLFHTKLKTQANLEGLSIYDYTKKQAIEGFDDVREAIKKDGKKKKFEFKF